MPSSVRVFEWRPSQAITTRAPIGPSDVDTGGMDQLAVEARVLAAARLEDEDAPAAVCQRRGHGAARQAAADDDDVRIHEGRFYHKMGSNGDRALDGALPRSAVRSPDPSGLRAPPRGAS